MKKHLRPTLRWMIHMTLDCMGLTQTSVIWIIHRNVGLLYFLQFYQNVCLLLSLHTHIRPPLCLLFFSMWDLWDPWADLREILPHVQKHVQFINAIHKFGGLPPNSFLGPKKCQNWRNFGPLPTSSMNISEMDRDIQNLKTWCTTAFPPTFGEKSLVNFGPLFTKI